MRTLSMLILVVLQVPTVAQRIPYPEALNEAAIVQSSIDNLDKKAMIVGNGDINALIYAKNDELVMHLAKNDVWDARLITEKDPPLLKVDVEKHSFTGGGRPASWNHPYPTQTPPALIRIHAIGEVTQAKIDLKRGLASVVAGGHRITVRALAQKNVYTIETDRRVSLEGFAQDFLPAAEKTQGRSVTIVKQQLPNDPDYPGMDVFSVLESRGNRYAVAVVTTRESAQALTDALRLARTVLDQAPQALIDEHQQWWWQFWSRSGVKLEDRDLQNWWYRQLYYLRCLSRPGADINFLHGTYLQRTLFVYARSDYQHVPGLNRYFVRPAADIVTKPSNDSPRPYSPRERDARTQGNMAFGVESPSCDLFRNSCERTKMWCHKD